MGYPFEEATWNVLEGAMYIGAGGAAPLLYTLIGVAICIATLVVGNASEQKRYAKYND